MKNWILILAAAVLLGFTACSGKYEENYPQLRVSHSVLNVDNAADNVYYVWVYYSGKWNAHVQEGCDWMSIQNPQGKGKTLVGVKVTGAGGQNVDRTGLLHFNADGQEECIINIRQKVTAN